MQARPGSVPIFLVIGSIVWITVTIGCLSVIVPAPAENEGLALGLALMWLLLVVYAVVERWTGGHSPGAS